MKNTFSRSTFAALFATVLAFAPLSGHARQGGDIGVGFIAGDPSGLSGKVWMGQNNALDFIVGFSIPNDWISLNADYVWHDFSILPVSRGQLPLYYGIGLWTAIGKHSPGVGARGVVGLTYLFPSAPLDAFVEIGPGAAILPETEFNMSGGLGMRFYF